MRRLSILVFLISPLIAYPAWAGNIDLKLISAAQRGDPVVVEHFLENGANVNARSWNGKTALLLAVRNNHINIIKTLLEKGADVNEKNSFGYTVLWYAIANGNIEIVQALLDDGVNVRDKNGITALVYAKVYDNTQILKLLKKAGAKE